MSATLPVGAGAASLTQPYTSVAKMFHWLTVVLLVVQYLTEFVLKLVPKTVGATLVAWHLSVGPTILLVVLLRLAWRLTHPPPPAPVDLSPPVRLLSRATHWLLYALLIVQPLLGWTAASAYGATAYLLGVIPLPALAAKDEAFGTQVGHIHGAVALLLLATIALHVSGALYHALIKRDGVTGRILPARS